MVTVLSGAPEASGPVCGQSSQGFWWSCCQNAGAAFQKPRGGFLHGQLMAKSEFPETV